MWCIMQQIKDESGSLDTPLENIARELAHLGIVVSDPPVMHEGVGLETERLERLSAEDMQQ